MRFYLKKEVKQLLDNSNGEIKAATKSSFHLAKGTSNGLYQIKGITSSNEPNIVHISEDINMLNKKSGKIIHHHKNYKLKKSGIKNLLKESPLKLTDGIIRPYVTPDSRQALLDPAGVFRKLHQNAASPPEIMRNLPISGEKKENKIKVKSKIKKNKSEKKDKLEIKKDKENEKKIKSVIKKDKKKETKEAKDTKKKVKSEIKKDKSKKKGEKKIKSEIKKLKKVITENK